MQIVHRVSFRSSPDIKRELVRLGHVVPDGGLVSLDVDEGDANWPGVEKWIAGRSPVDIVTTRFTPTEIAAATWVELMPSWHRGYPQPEGDSAFMGVTYDLTAYCSDCGVGAKQNAPFRMRTEPRWGRNDVLQLNWVFDEFFATPRAFKAVFEPFGVTCRPVTDRKGRTLETVVQLAITDDVEMDKDGLQPTVCEVCTRTKFLPHTRGPFPALTGTPGAPLARTVEEFGSGPSASRRIVASAAVAAALVSAGIRGLKLRPVAR